jgi:hypothetical protein
MRLLLAPFLVLSVLALALVSLSCVNMHPAVQALEPRSPAALAWGEPLVIRWNQSIQDFAFEVSPPAAAESRIAEDGKATYVYLEPRDDSSEYRVVVTRAEAVSGAELAEPASFRVDVARRPHLLESAQPVRPNEDDAIALRWDQPIKSLSFEVDGREGKWRADANDPKTTWLEPGLLPQGVTTTLQITEATTREGAPLVEPVSIAVKTPPALTVAFEANPYIGRVPLDTHPTFTFSQPIREGAAPPEQWVTFVPAIDGRFEWLADDTLAFIPEALPSDEVVHATIHGGPDGPRAVAGGYIEPKSATYRFVTEPNKIIDVSLSQQRMTLLEGGEAVQTFPVATGVRGADTPVGEFRVQYKMPVARFVGVNTVGGSRYDIPDVHWVLAFSGDYTIHGAYWRSAFGRPGSNGCVSLSDPNAKVVFDWAPPGTLIRIHD